MMRPRTPGFRRRALSGVVPVLVLALVLAACGGDSGGTTTTGADTPATDTTATDTTATDTTGAAGAAGAGAWIYTDDRPETLTADTPPQRVVAYEEDAATLMRMGIRPVAIFGSGPMEGNVFLEGLDLTGIESVGEVWGEVDIEKLAALSPDLIVNSFWGSQQTGGGWGFANEDMFTTLEAIAPIVAIDSGTSAIQTTNRYLELAESLGADMDAPDLVAQLDAYEAATQRLEAAVAANPGISILAVGAYPGDQVYVANPGTFPDLVDLLEYGVEFITPEELDDNIWEYVSWEEIPKYQPDLLLVDQRPGAPTFEDLAEVPTWNQLTAVQEGQLTPWNVASVESFQRQADRIDSLAEAIENADDIT